MPVAKMDFATCTIESAFAGQVGLVLHAMSTADQLVNSLKTRTFILIAVGSGSSRRLHATASNNVKTLGCCHADTIASIGSVVSHDGVSVPLTQPSEV